MSLVGSKVKATIAFTTLGCRVNQYDTQALKEQMERASFRSVPFEESADIYVINTCTVTAAADAEGKMLVRRAKTRNPNSFVVVTGCLAEDRPEEVAGLSGVDLVVGNKEKYLLLNKIASRYSNILDENKMEADPWNGGISRFDGHQRATVKVQEGCNFACAFCLIPRVRGSVISRPVLDILEEGKRLAANGVKELVLTGIQLSSYGRDRGLKASEPRLAPVIEGLLALSGIQRVRLSSYAVADFEDALLPLWKNKVGLCSHLHLPLQSGDESMLKAMRRPYRLEDYRQTVHKIREVCPELGLTTDIIAGFPGETEEAFGNTMDRIQEFDFADLHPFPYSDRPGTPGEAMEPKVREGVTHARMKRLWKVKRERIEGKARKAEAKTYPIIVERFNERLQSGLTEDGLRVVFPYSKDLLGREAYVMVTGIEKGQALGRIL